MLTANQSSRYLCGAILSALLGGSVLADGTVHFVDDDAGPGGDGTSWVGAFANLQDALSVTAAGDEIRVAQGTYRPDVGAGYVLADRDASFWLESGLLLRGGFRGLAGGGSPDDHDPSTFITTLSGDLAGDDGPDFANNAENSWAVGLRETQVLVEHCLFEGNSADWRGGGFMTVSNHGKFEVRGVIARGAPRRFCRAASGGAEEPLDLEQVVWPWRAKLPGR